MQPKLTTALNDTGTGLPGVGSGRKRHKDILRLVFTADNHLRMTCNGSAARGRDFFRAALSVVDVAKEVWADAILNGGDLFNTPESLPLLTQQLQELDQYLQKEDLPMHVIQGNHDFAEPSWVTVQQGNHKRGATAGVFHADGLILDGLVLALPFLSPDDLRKRLVSLTEEEKKAKILMWHGQVLEFCKFPVDNVVTIQDFMVHNWEAVLLGDIHQRSFVNVTRPDGGTCVVGYPGATELCKSDEPLEHTCTVLEVDKTTGKVLAMSHVPVDHRKVLALRINDEAELAEAVVKIQETAKQHPDVMVLTKFSDALPGVRHALQRAVGERAIIRAEAYPSQIQTTSGREATSAVKTPKEYLPSFQLPTGLLRLCENLCNPDSEVSPAVMLEKYCSDHLTPAA